MKKLIVILFLFLFIPFGYSNEINTTQTSIQSLDFENTYNLVFFIFITILSLLVGIYVNGEFGSFLMIMLGLVLLVSNISYIFAIFYIFLGIILIGWEK